MTTQTPKLRFPEFSDKWEVKKLGDEIQDSGYGPRFNGDDYSIDGNVKTIRGTDISLDGEIIYNQVPLASLDENFIKTHILEDGDLVMITTADCGLTGVFRKQEMNYIPSAYAVKLKLRRTSSPYYFKFFFQTEISKNQVNKFIRKATVANLPASDILRFTLTLPQLPEQTKIANFLTAIDEKIQALKQKKTLLEQYKKGIMQQIFSQELRFKNDDGADFDDWEEKSLGEIATFSKGKGVSKKDIDENGEFECIRYGELYTHYKETIEDIISKTNIPKKDLVFSEYNDVIIPASGETQIDIATASCVLKTGVALGGDLNIIKTKLNGVFLSYYLNTSKKQEIASLAQGISVVHLYSSQLQLLEIQVPSLSEQQKIANFLTAIDEKIEKVSQQISTTETYKKGLLQQMFI